MLRPEANNYQYLFLGGILGEVLSIPFAGNYLKINRLLLRDLGVRDIECITLNSFKNAQQNAETLVELIHDLYRKKNRPLVIIAHSKASLELMICLMENLSLFQDKVKKIICVQPPFQGSAMFERYDFLKQFWPGLKCLEANHYSELFAENLVKNEVAQQYMKENLLVVRGHKPKTRNVSWLIRGSHFMMKRSGHENDGLVKLKDQVIPNATYTEMVLEMDHSDLFASKVLSNQDDHFRRKVLRDLVNWVIDS